MSEKEDEICCMICCMNCRHCYVLEKLDYSHGGCEHSQPDGFICMALTDEGVASWMVGLDGRKNYCECWEAPK